MKHGKMQVRKFVPLAFSLAALSLVVVPGQRAASLTNPNQVRNLTAASGGSVGLPAPIRGQNYSLVWDDEFTQPDWDGDRNVKAPIKWYNGLRCCGADIYFPNRIGVNPYSIESGGGLDITLSKHHHLWVSGVLETHGRNPNGYSFTFGYVEVKAQMSPGPATWPAIWFDSPFHHNRQHIEIDAPEFYGSRPNQVEYDLHDWQVGNCSHANDGCSVGFSVVTLPGLTQSLHRYGMLWTPSKMIFYIDDHLVWSTQTLADFRSPVELILDNGIGAGQNKSGQQNSTMRIKYVRIYQLHQ